MIDAGPSLAAATDLDWQSVVAFLVTDGWTVAPSKMDGYAIASKRVDGGQAVQAVIPSAANRADEQQRIADILRMLAALKGTSLDEIVEQVRASISAISRPTPATQAVDAVFERAISSLIADLRSRRGTLAAETGTPNRERSPL